MDQLSPNFSCSLFPRLQDHQNFFRNLELVLQLAAGFGLSARHSILTINQYKVFHLNLTFYYGTNPDSSMIFDSSTV